MTFRQVTVLYKQFHKAAFTARHRLWQLRNRLSDEDKQTISDIEFQISSLTDQARQIFEKEIGRSWTREN